VAAELASDFRDRHALAGAGEVGFELGDHAEDVEESGNLGSTSTN